MTLLNIHEENVMEDEEVAATHLVMQFFHFLALMESLELSQVFSSLRAGGVLSSRSGRAGGQTGGRAVGRAAAKLAEPISL